MNVESWCQVEENAKASWLRAKRKHFPNAMKSTVFKTKLPDRFQLKGPAVNELSLADLPKLRRFPNKCELH